MVKNSNFLGLIHHRDLRVLYLMSTDGVGIGIFRFSYLMSIDGMKLRIIKLSP